MKLLALEPNIELYQTGFNTDDLLGRKSLGEKLSNICENIEIPLTVAVNGAWGTGKTDFLQKWVGAHGLENGGKALTVYLSAFNHDYLEDPLPSIILAIEERLQTAEEKAKFRPAMKSAGKAIMLGLYAGGRAVLNSCTGGMSETAINIIEKQAGRQQKSYWQAEKGKCAAMEDFHAQIAEFAKTRPLIIIIDELDRAKPDYALAVLEAIKHFFNVGGVKFILGVNLNALAQMVQKRYGFELAEAQKYLERFINFSVTLPDTMPNGQNNSIAYYEWAAEKMGLCVDSAETFLLNHLKFVTKNTPISLRDIQRILTKFTLTAASQNHKIWESTFFTMEICLALISSEIVRPDLYPKFLNATITADEVLLYYNIQKPYEELEQSYNNYIGESQFNRNFAEELEDTVDVALSFLKKFLSEQLLHMRQKYYPGYKEALQAAAAFLWIKILIPLSPENLAEDEDIEEYDLKDIFKQFELVEIDLETAIPKKLAERYIDILNLDIKITQPIPPSS